MERIRATAAALVLLLLALAAGCNRPVETLPGAPEAPPAVDEPTPPEAGHSAMADLKPAKPETPAVPIGAAVTAVGADLVLTGVGQPRLAAWSPSGSRVLVQSDSLSYLLDTAEPSVQPMQGLDSWDPVFWTETELLWLDRGSRALLRNLETGADRLIHDFGGQVIHYLQPGDTHYVVNRTKGVVQQGYRFGTIVAGELGGQSETVLIETGHLIGRMATGHVLAVEGFRGGPLWALLPTGEKRLLSPDDAYFVQLSPDGGRALWFTRSGEASALTAPRRTASGLMGGRPLALLLDLFRPRIAYADPPYDPPLTDLWTWDGIGDPVRIPLGGTYSARAQFSPDGERIALSLNEEIWTELPPGEERQPLPGHVAVVEGDELRVLATFDDLVGIGIWLGSDGFRFMPPMEKTGAQGPILRIDLNGQQSELKGGLWYQPGNYRGPSLIVNWRGGDTTVYWSDSERVAQVEIDPNHLGEPLYVPPVAQYLPFEGRGSLHLKRLAPAAEADF